MDILLILPNQLFTDISVIPTSIRHIYIIEEPHYFSSNDIKPNKIKISYLRASMRYYYINILKKSKISSTYIDIDYIKKKGYDFIKDGNIYIYEINDFKLRDEYLKYQWGSNIIELRTPMFLMTLEDLDEYNKKYKSPSHASFYEMVKNKLDILNDIKNQDVYNRSNPRSNIPIVVETFINKSNSSFYKEAIEYSEKPLFKEHIGNPTLDTLGIYPINSNDAYEYYKRFIKMKLDNFGTFQDVIQEDNPFMYHSIISPMLNNGLLIPSKLIEIIREYREQIPINAYEGFIRQIIGWREYMRYLYLYKYNKLITSNLHNNKKRLPLSWYNGTTGNKVLDNEINKAIKYGYAHHIIRLMVFLSYMIMYEICPEDIYKWFMEVVSIDAYDWVMISNIYSMGYFAPIGMKRPYLSSSNYILKMSNYKKDGKWDIEWTNLFRNFVKSRKINFYLRSIK
jgi:deoxyribodipyrimidine photolyase-related protein